MALQTFGISPYFDDYNEDDRYLKILFRPGFAVQTRELNQMQSIIQNQIERFGNHIFENGSLVLNGETSLEPNQKYLKLKPATQIVDGGITLSQKIETNKSLYEGRVVRKQQIIQVVMKEVSNETQFEAGDYIETTTRSFAGTINSVASEVINNELIVTISVTKLFGTLTDSDTLVAAFNSDDPQAIPAIPNLQSPKAIATVQSLQQVAVSPSTPVDLTEAVVNRVEPATAVDPLTLYVAYSSGSGIEALGEDQIEVPDTFDINDELVIERKPLTDTLRYEIDVISVENAPEAVGEGTFVRIREGVYYLFGFFHLIEQQDVILKKYSNLTINDTFTVGLYAEQDIVTPEENRDLLDNARGSVNFSAPGAHRYKVFPRFVNGADFADDENYVEIVKIERGEITRLVNRTFYSVIEDTLARRTFDESGNYVVKDFTLEMKEHADTGDNNGYFPFDPDNPDNIGDLSKLVALVGSGKAFVKGYESETIADTPVDIDKAREFETLDDVPVFLRSGNFVYVKNLNEIPVDQDNPSNSAPPVDLLNSNGDTIGSAKVKGVITEGTDPLYHRVYLFDIETTQFGNTRSIRLDPKVAGDLTTANTADLVLENDVDGISDASVINNVATLTRSSNADTLSVFELPIGTVARFENQNSVTVNNFSFRFTSPIVTSQEATQASGVFDQISFTVSEADFSALPEDYVLVQFDDNASGINHQILEIEFGAIIRGAQGNTIDIDLTKVVGADTSKQRTFRIQTFVEATNSSPRVKTLTGVGYDINLGQVDESTAEEITVSPLQREFFLANVDGVKLHQVAIKENDGQGGFNYTDVSQWFELDGGQRDSYYDRAQLKMVEDGTTLPSGTVIAISYTHFQHGEGDYFSLDSYAGIEYEKIPVYLTSVGTEIPLANALDFRLSVDTGNTNTEGTTYSSERIFQPDTDVEVEYSFHLSRIDKIVINTKGEVEVLKGIAARSPVPPSDKEDSINLYQIKVPPYTFSINDLEIKKFDNRRFTMKDIGEIQNRVENLEYYTLLSLLEVDTINKDIPGKFKSGFIVDNFETQEIGDASTTNHKIATDIENKLIRPMGITKNVNLELDSSSGVKLNPKADVVTLDYEEFISVSQPLASRLEKITALLTFGWFGQMKLTPSVDNWHSRRQRPDVTLDGGVAETAKFTRLKDSLGTIWNNWRTSWTGVVAQNTRTSSQTVTPARWVNNRLQTTVRTTRTTTTTTAVRQTRSGVVNTPITRTVTTGGANKLVSQVAVPFMRSRIISFEASGLKPNTQVFLFMDGNDITGFVTETQRNAGAPVSFASESPVIVTDAAGNIKGKFRIPNTPSLKIRSGVKSVNVTDAGDGGEGETSASTTYTSVGTISTFQRTFVATRVLDVDQRIVRDSRTLTNTSRRSTSTVASRTLATRPAAQNLRYTSARIHHIFDYRFIAFGQDHIVTLSGHMHGGFRVERYNNSSDWRSGSNGTIVFRSTSNFISRASFRTQNFRFFRVILENKPNAGGVFGRRTHFHNVSIRFANGVVRPTPPRRRDPTAQSFVLTSTGGGFVTGMDLFFGVIPQNNRFPVTVQIRNMVNGYPGPEIMPFASIQIPANQLVGSSDASLPFRVNFDAPVFLEQDREYSVVILTDSPDITVWLSRLGDISLPYVDKFGNNVSSQQIVKQPSLGSLFRSQNNTTWNAIQEEDLKFNLYQAKFNTDTNGIVTFNNKTIPTDIGEEEVDPYIAEIDEDGLETFEGSRYLRIHQDGHGFEPGIDRVFITPAPGFEFDVNDLDNSSYPEFINGFSFSEIFSQNGHLVKNRVESDATLNDDIDPDYYYIELSDTAIDSGRVEIADVYATENTAFSVAYFKTDEIKLNGTEINWTFSGNPKEGARITRTSPVPVATNDNQYFDRVYVSSGNETNDVILVGSMSTTNENLTPVIDIEQVGLLATDNRINAKKDNRLVEVGGNESIQAIETPTGFRAAARYIMKKVDLVNPADQLRIFLDANVPPGADVEVFYKYNPEGSEQVFETQPWRIATPLTNIVRTEDETDFSEVQYNVEDINENFTSFTIKIVFSATNTAKVPRVKNLRGIALKNSPE